ncbi:MAG: hypothetical protein LBQ98_10030 [Nitrososphaerota archaeon]|jgi:hypothetical protein|nr:hypothetical protein [Nitrososphaerota archaeon]
MIERLMGEISKRVKHKWMLGRRLGFDFAQYIVGADCSGERFGELKGETAHKLDFFAFLAETD